MRSLVLLITFFIVQNVFAGLPGASKEATPQPPQFTKLIDHMTNPELESLVPLADQVTGSSELGDCPHFVYRVKMTLPPNINYDAAINEFVSMITPGARTFTFGILSANAPASESILRMASAELSAPAEAQLASLNSQTDAALECNTNTVLMAGTAVYSGAGVIDANMSVRAIVDGNANEFLIFGAGQCH